MTIVTLTDKEDDYVNRQVKLNGVQPLPGGASLIFKGWRVRGGRLEGR